MKKIYYNIAIDYGYEKDYFVPENTFDKNCMPITTVFCNGWLSLYFRGIKEHSYYINSFGRLVELPKGHIKVKILDGEMVPLFRNWNTKKVYIINDQGVLVREVSDNLW